jgi:hypothetical protein
MDVTTARPTLLSAAKNFMRKSAGTAVLAIAPLAAVSLAPEAQAQTLFGTPGLNSQFSSGASMLATFPGGNRFMITPGGAPGGITTSRFGVDGNVTTSSGGPSSITTTLQIFTAITGADIPGTTYIPISYDFTLSKQAGTIGNVNWLLKAGITGDGSPVNIGSGTLTSGSATFTGAGGYTTLSNVLSDGSLDLEVFLYLTYTTSAGDNLFVGMNSASQGITVNAIPEPSTYALLLGLGTLGLVIVRRSRRGRA